MNKVKPLFIAALMFGLLWVNCKPNPPDSQPVLTVRGIYEGTEASEAEAGSDTPQPEDRSGARVEAYDLSDNGTQTLVAGGAQELTTEEQGAFEIPIFTTVQNLVIKIIQKNREQKCIITGISYEPASSHPDTRLFRRCTQNAGSADNTTEYAIVNGETNIEASMVLSELEINKTPPDQINTQEIDDLIDPSISRDLQDNSTLRDCVVGLLTKGRISARELFIAILEDQTINQDRVENAEQVIREAIKKIETLRHQTRKAIYELKLSGDNNTQAQIDALLAQQREQVLAIFKQAGIPPQLYMKASLIAQSALERFIFKVGPLCAPGQIALGNKLIRRVLIRRVQEDAHQTITVLRDEFAFESAAEIDAARAVFEETLMGIDPNLDAGPTHGSALRIFYQVVVSNILAAVDDRIASDQAIINLLQTMRSAQPQLSSKLQAAQDSEAVKKAYLDYFNTFRDAVQLALPFVPEEPEQTVRQKKILRDLLFSISIH